MSNRKAINNDEVVARANLVLLAKSMLDGSLSYFEGAIKVMELKWHIGGIQDVDPDFNTFVAIVSETDHLPAEAQKHLWAKEALVKLEAEYDKTEKWASDFGHEACRNFINRFSNC